MAKILFVHSRRSELIPELRQRLAGVRDLLNEGFDLDPCEHLAEGADSFLYTFRNSVAVQREGTSCLLGVVRRGARWSKPGTTLPDGSYGIVREDSQTVELCTDTTASRTIWYYEGCDIFVASSSQLAILQIIGGFRFRGQIRTWFLATGAQGPDEGWDERIHKLPPRSVLRFDKEEWRSSLQCQSIHFSPELGSTAGIQHYRSFLDSSVAELDIPMDSWVLPLSGGFDSRTLLMLLSSRSKVRTITWGTSSSLENAYSDASIAKRVAQHFQVPNEFLLTESATLTAEQIVDRFLICSEGRVSNVSMYMDGMQLWQNLFQHECFGIVRGDNCVGWPHVGSGIELRLWLDLSLWEDYAGLPDLSTVELPSQHMPDALHRQPSEGLQAWRDRLHQGYRLPVVKAGLSDVKLSFVEVCNPLLANELVESTWVLSDKLRTGKMLLDRILQKEGPKIPYARDAAIASFAQLLRQPELAGYLVQMLDSSAVRDVFSPALIQVARKSFDRAESGESAADGVKGQIAKLLPRRIKGALRKSIKPVLDGRLLALRMVLFSRIHEKIVQKATLPLED